MNERHEHEFEQSSETWSGNWIEETMIYVSFDRNKLSNWDEAERQL